MKYAINEFKNSKKEKMILWCLKENYPSRAFYEKMGLKPKETQMEYIIKDQGDRFGG